MQAACSPRTSPLRWLFAALSLVAFLGCVLFSVYASADDAPPSDLSSEEQQSPLDSDAEDDVESSDEENAVGLPFPHATLDALSSRETNPSHIVLPAHDGPYLEREPRPPCFV